MMRGSDGSRYVVGIDLGTTNSAVAWVDLQDPDGKVSILRVPQLTAPGTIEALEGLPSCLYLPSEGESREGLQMPWQQDEANVAGTFALRRLGASPDQVVHSAKSWLCHRAPGPDEVRLPEGFPGGSGLTAMEVSAAYLAHLREAWDSQMARQDDSFRLAAQDVVLTVPASFDAAARDLTLSAARAAGIPDPQLLEEPQAAVYHWAGLNGERLRENLSLGDTLLVCDLGGGTTDFSLLCVAEDDGDLHLQRVAVGNHVLLGGDNMDLALAFRIREKLAASGTRLDAQQFRSLVASCREGKEKLLADESLTEFPVVVLARSRKLLGGSVRATLDRETMNEVLLDGFFPVVEADQRLADGEQAGLAEIGLPFAQDPSVTTHLAEFLRLHRHQLGNSGRPSHLLLNGGVFAASALVARLREVLGNWADAENASPPQLLLGGNLAEGVARGAAVFGASRRGRGMRIRGGAARSYYVGMASSMPAVPGQPAPQRSVCVVPFGLEEGSRITLEGTQFGLLLGTRASFRLYASTTRDEDAAGTVLDEFETADLEELAPLSAELEGVSGDRVQVHLEAFLSEIGTLEVYFVGPEQARWELTFGVRSHGDKHG